MTGQLATSQFSCPHFTQCSGCNEGIDDKFTRLTETLRHELHLDPAASSSNFSVIKIPVQFPHGLRDRADFVWDHDHLGLFDQSKTKIIGIDQCWQLSPELNEWFQVLKKFKFPIKKGSLRLRVGPSPVEATKPATKGLWLDFANLDVKALFDEMNFLRELMKLSVVEVGQRHKRLVDSGYKLSLVDPVLDFWSNSLHQDKLIPLYGSIADFTQVGHQANQVILRTLKKMLAEYQAITISEFGSGQGNLSFVALENHNQLIAHEISKTACEGFRRSLKEQDLMDRVQIHHGDFQRQNPVGMEQSDLILVNPPRSGLKSFVDGVPLKSGPSGLVYMSCYLESFIIDSRRIKALGFSLKELCFIDQFPQTDHVEILSHWTR